MTQINHAPTKDQYVEFRSLQAGDVFKLEEGKGLLMKILPAVEYCHGSNDYWRIDGHRDWRFRDVERVSTHNAVFLTGPSVGCLCEFGSSRLVLSAKVCNLKTEF